MIIPILFFSFSNYNLNHDLEYFLNISQSTYCTNSLNYKCPTCMNSKLDLWFNINENNQRILIGTQKIDNKTFISFRGSDNIENWIDNIKFFLFYPYPTYPNIGIEKGFYQQYQLSKNKILDKIKFIQDKTNNNKIIVTGHSLGGALSTVLVTDILINNIDSLKIDKLITFGSPRVGDYQLFKFLNYSFLNKNITSFRVTHYHDIVPHLPPSIFNYHHIGQEIWLDENNYNYKLCNGYGEDSDCSDSCKLIECRSISDHLDYLNISMGSGKICNLNI